MRSGVREKKNIEKQPKGRNSLPSRNTGLLTSHFFSPWMISPGSAPTYVRRCPRISDSSHTPPREIRWNFLPIAVAIDRPSEVLPTYRMIERDEKKHLAFSCIPSLPCTHQVILYTKIKKSEHWHETYTRGSDKAEDRTLDIALHLLQFSHSQVLQNPALDLL